MQDPHINPATGVWDDNYYANTGKYMSSGGIPTFSFDYAGEAQKAYGELGVYYDRILREAQGDMNKALARLTQDYDRGLRISREDYATQQQALNTREQSTIDSVKDNALARGLYRKSAYGEGMGITDTNIQEAKQPIQMQRDLNQRSLSRYEEESLLQKQRQETDLPEAFERQKHDQEQNRRKESASMAEQRGARAYQDFQAKMPTYV